MFTTVFKNMSQGCVPYLLNVLH